MIEDLLKKEDFSFNDLLNECDEETKAVPDTVVKACEHKETPKDGIVMNGKALLNPRRLAFEHIKINCPLDDILPNKQYVLYGVKEEGELIINRIENKN